MSTWAVRRQLSYVSVVSAILLVIIALPVYFIFFNKTPTCFDNILNQNEREVDCGGVCNKVCPDEIRNEPISTWVHSFKVTKGIYNLVAYIQNPNINYISEPTGYTFQVYDNQNVLIASRSGVTTIPPNKSFPIFEAGVDTGERVPFKVFFQFDSKPVWHNLSDASNLPKFDIVDTVLENASTSPHLSSSIKNNSFYSFSNVEVVAILYDENENAIASSRTYIDSIDKNSSQSVNFTWPEAFISKAVRIEIVPRFPISINQ